VEAFTVRIDTQLKLADYWRAAGLNLGRQPFATRAEPLIESDQKRFTQVLKSFKVSRYSGPQGLTLRDYLANPVQASKSAKMVDKAVQETPRAEQDRHRHNSTAPASQGLSEETPPEQQGLSSQRQRIKEAIGRAAAKFDLPVNLIEAVVKAESAYQVGAQSAAGAQGLMQLMPATAKELGVDDPFDIRQNIDGGARYLSRMLERYEGDIEKALSAYNAGPGTVDKYAGRVPYPETRAYVKRVLAYSHQLASNVSV
jgi:soluble lytic murein transglycosylase-like protein